MIAVNLAGATRIGFAGAARLRCCGAILIDVRQGAEFESPHHPDTRRLALKDVIAHARLVAVETPMIYYCDCGRQETSARAVLLVQKHVGQRTVAAFVGSTDEWNALQHLAVEPGLHFTEVR
jgi:rhodanese-related sulfurtransferase